MEWIFGILIALTVVAVGVSIWDYYKEEKDNGS